MLDAVWVEARDVSDPAQIAAVAEKLGLKAQALVRNRERKRETERKRERDGEGGRAAEGCPQAASESDSTGGAARGA
jgi:2-hydroxychromene-2-carboxylate isomerase